MRTLWDQWLGSDKHDSRVELQLQPQAATEAADSSPSIQTVCTHLIKMLLHPT